MKDEERGPLPHHIAIIMDGNGRWANVTPSDGSLATAEGRKPFDER